MGSTHGDESGWYQTSEQATNVSIPQGWEEGEGWEKAKKRGHCSINQMPEGGTGLFPVLLRDLPGVASIGRVEERGLVFFQQGLAL